MADAQARFWSKVAGKYERVVDRQIGGKTRSMIRDRVDREARLGHVIELGCGTGFYTEALVPKADTLLATDISPGMLELAKQRVKAPNVTFQAEDCQRTTLPDGAFDAAFISLVLHFTEPGRTLAETHRILRPGGALLVANLDPTMLIGLDRIRCLARVLVQGAVGYRVKPPKGLGRNVVGERELRELLRRSDFRVDAIEAVRDPSRSSNIPIQYVRATKGAGAATGPETRPS